MNDIPDIFCCKWLTNKTGTLSPHPPKDLGKASNFHEIQGKPKEFCLPAQIKLKQSFLILSMTPIGTQKCIQ